MTKKITLDLNGFKITGDVTSTGDLTIKGNTSTGDNNNKIVGDVFCTTGDLTLKEITIVGNVDSWDGVLTVDGTKVIGGVYISGDSATFSENTVVNGVVNVSDANVVINGGTYTGVNNALVTDCDTAVVTVKAGTFTANAPVYSDAGTIKIEGGSFKALGSFSAGFEETVPFVFDALTSIQISGGIFSSKDYYIFDLSAVDPYITYGSSFIGYVKTGYEIVNNTDTSTKTDYPYMVSKIVRAKIGTTEYATLQAALDAASDNDEIVLTGDVTETTVTSSSKVTINLNGYKYTGDITATADMTVKGASCADPAKNSVVGTISSAAGTLTLDSVTADYVIANMDIVIKDANVTDDVTSIQKNVTVNNSKIAGKTQAKDITVSGSSEFLDTVTASNKVTITDGQFRKSVTATNGGSVTGGKFYASSSSGTKPDTSFLADDCVWLYKIVTPSTDSYWYPQQINLGMDGSGQYVKESNASTSLRCYGEYTYFSELSIDGTSLTDGNQFVSSEGSTVITFSSAYLNTLSPGTYSIQFKYDYFGTFKYATGTLIIKPAGTPLVPYKVPKTGVDNK